MSGIYICDIYPGLVPELEYLKNVFAGCLQVADLSESYHVVRAKRCLAKHFSNKIVS
jgi:hypothetical protein